MLSHCPNIVPIRPKFTAPQLLLHGRDTPKNLAGSQTFDHPHNFGRAIGRHRLHQKMYMISIRSNFKKEDLVPCRNLQADLPQHLIYNPRHDQATIFRWTNNVIQQNRKALVHEELTKAVCAGNFEFMLKRTKPCPYPKALYRVKNWRAYDTALVQRGSITFWLSDDFEKHWLYTGEKQRGSQFDYSDQAIEIMLTVKEVFHLTNRQTEGFLRSVFTLLKLSLPVPDHSTLSKRGKKLKVKLPKTTHQQLSLVIDSTGLKIYGDGEWTVRQHGVSKRRTWRKLHLGVNPEDGEIQAVLLTENNVSDDEAVADLLAQIAEEIVALAADGAYDKRKVYDGVNEHSPHAEILIPPRLNARIWQHGNSKEAPHPRDENLRYIRQHGRHQWKEDSGYHMRSLVETLIFRLKTIFGDKLSARLVATQTTQALIRCVALNKMTQLGMPQSYKVA